MKNYKRNVNTLLLLFIIIFSSCQTNDKDNIIQTNERAQIINEAKKWYELNVKNGVSELKYVSDEKKINVIPNWSQSFRRQNKEFLAVESALKWDVRVSYASQDCYEAYLETGDVKYLISLTRLVILKEMKSQETSGFFICIVPSRDYRDSKSNPFKDITYLDKKDFTGKIAYLDLNGSFINGDIYEDGNIIGSFEWLGSKLLKSNTPGSGIKPCHHIPVYRTEQECSRGWDEEGFPTYECEDVDIFDHWEINCIGD